ncbi:MAG: glycoside hydrolase family 127 protein [Breznakibacter sp.]
MRICHVLLCLLPSMGLAQLKPFDLRDVKLGNSPFADAQTTSYRYVMAHDPDRLLAPFRREAGLEPKALSYGNWENTGLDGHVGGHYLTALAQIVATTGDKAATARLDYMLDELELCQKANGNGYIGGVPGSKEMWDDVAHGNLSVGSFSLNRKWVPLYNIHKTFSGLRDVYLLTGNGKARQMWIALTDWCVNLCANLTDEQIQDILRSEHGGMNEVLADAYAVTGNGTYLELARKFSHQTILQPLAKHEDKLNGMHANTQIPKVIGFERIGELAHDSVYHEAAKFFWETVTRQRSVAIGGNSVREHFHPSGDFTAMIEDREGPETCNTYNMLKLSKMLYLSSGDLRYIDFYERAMYNHILSSQHPGHGGLVYFTSMRPRHYRVYSKAEIAFWCCVGSGMENHSKYNELIYAHNDDDLYVNLFVPSTLTWKDKGLTLEQRSSLPSDDKVTFRLALPKPRRATIHFRYPQWVNAGELVLKINGKSVPVTALPGTYVSVVRKWKNNDRVELVLPMHTRAEFLPDGSKWAALVHGPFVLAAKSGIEDMPGLVADGSRMGHVAGGPLYSITEAPLLVVDPQNVDQLVVKTSSDGKFRLTGGVYPDSENGLELEPFYHLHDARYQVYWQFTTADEVEAMKRQTAEKEVVRLALEARTIDFVAPGEQQPESDHRIQFEKSETGVHRDRHWRHAQGWFSYDMKQPHTKAVLQLTFFGQDRNRRFNILVNNVVVMTVELDGSQGDTFFEKEIVLPAEVVGKSADGKINVRFEALSGSIAGGIYGVRLLKAAD